MHLRFVIVLISVALIAPAGFAQDKNGPTADELVAKNIEAKGGASALRDLQSLRLSGKMLVQQGQIQLAYLETKKRPDEVRTEASLQGMTQIEAYNGKEGWKISPFFGRKDPERMSADDAKALIEDAEIDGPLVDWKAKGSKVEYLGTEDVEGTLAHKLKRFLPPRTGPVDRMDRRLDSHPSSVIQHRCLASRHSSIVVDNNKSAW